VLAYQEGVSRQLTDPVDVKSEGIRTLLCNNLSDRLRIAGISELDKLLDLLPAPQLASVLAVLFELQSEVSAPSREIVQIIPSFISKLVSLLPDEDLLPETFEIVSCFAEQLLDDDLDFEGMLAWDIASLLSYASVYVSTTQATTQPLTPEATLHPQTLLPTPQATPQPPTLEAVTH
jgi:hypothetical protein